jgi:hypothetical protein
MVKFKSNIFIDEKTLTKEEAKEFITFLEAERLRHIGHMKEYKKLVESDDVSDFKKILASTVVVRDIDDIEHIDETLSLLRAKFNIKVNFCSFRERTNY